MEIGVKATQLFGGGDVTSFFAAGASGGASSEQATATAIVNAQQREINRIRGYKLQLTPAENFRLGEIQDEILKIQEKTNNGTVRADELEDRVTLYEEADTILGKPVLEIETETDETYIDFVSALENLLEPKLNPAVAKRVEALERIKDTLEEQLVDRPDSPVLRGRFQSVSNTIDALKPLRKVEELSVQERRIYDETARALNDYVGVKLQLESREAIRVGQLERSIEQFSAVL